jgi:hypothetical protein
MICSSLITRIQRVRWLQGRYIFAGLQTLGGQPHPGDSDHPNFPNAATQSYHYVERYFILGWLHDLGLILRVHIFLPLSPYLIERDILLCILAS